MKVRIFQAPDDGAALAFAVSVTVVGIVGLSIRPIMTWLHHGQLNDPDLLSLTVAVFCLIGLIIIAAFAPKVRKARTELAAFHREPDTCYVSTKHIGVAGGIIALMLMITGAVLNILRR